MSKINYPAPGQTVRVVTKKGNLQLAQSGKFRGVGQLVIGRWLTQLEYVLIDRFSHVCQESGIPQYVQMAIPVCNVLEVASFQQLAFAFSAKTDISEPWPTK